MLFAKTIIAFLGLLLTHPLSAQKNNADEVRWSASKKLTWNEYKATPDENSGAAASTATYLGIEYHMNNNGFGYTITCHFSKSKSWVLHKTDHILAHEQGHFDIAEIFARKLNKQMSSYVFNKNTYKTELRNIYQRILDEKEALQNQYDAATNHSINKEKQAEWLIKIEKMLEEYKGYAGY